MKTVVCREDIKAEMDLFQCMQRDLQMLQAQVSMLQDRVSFLEAKNRIDIGLGTPTITSEYGQSVVTAANRIMNDGHWVVNDDQTITYVRG